MIWTSRVHTIHATNAVVVVSHSEFKELKITILFTKMKTRENNYQNLSIITRKDYNMQGHIMHTHYNHPIPS